MAQSLEGARLAKLQAQISIYFGERGGNLRAFQEGMRKIQSGEKVVCESCGGTLFNPTGGHKQDCGLVWSLLSELKGEPLDHA